MASKLWSFVKFAIGIGIIIFLVSYVGAEDVKNNLLQANPFLILVALCLSILTFFLSAFSLKKMLFFMNEKVKFKDVMHCTCSTFAWGIFLPSRLGDFFLIHFLRKKGVSLAKGFSTFLLDKELFLFMLSFLSLIGATIFFKNLVLALFSFIFIISFMLLYFINFDTKIFRWIFKKFKKETFGDDYVNVMKSYRSSLTPTLVYLFLIFLRWVVRTFCMFFLFFAFGVIVNPVIILFISSAEIFLTLIPITVSGLGFREGFAVFAYSNFGLANHLVLAVYLVSYLMGFLEAGLIFLLDKFFFDEAEVVLSAS